MMIGIQVALIRLIAVYMTCAVIMVILGSAHIDWPFICWVACFQLGYTLGVIP